ncbi:MAG: NAD(P)/FAD-dependent oxidoreductase [Flavobacteriaceae bacterium]
MRNVDYLIVGYGLAGMTLAKTLRAKGKSVVVITDQSQQSSLVAGGVWNPVILKRFTPVWRGVEILKESLEFFTSLSEDLNLNLLHYFDTYRILSSVGEQNDFLAACDRPGLKEFLEPQIFENTNPRIHADFGLGRVNGTGMLQVKEMLDAYRDRLEKEDCFISATVNYDDIDPDHIQIGNIVAKKLVFCEGYGMADNPYFNYLPLQHTKGEVLIIHAPELKMDILLKAGVFILPLGNDLYKIGATYEHKDKTNEPSEKGKAILLERLAPMIDCPFEVVGQKAGIRPTVSDRRPLVGQHPVHKNLFVLNGLGTRGVMNAPFCARKLSELMLDSKPLDTDIAIDRFYDRFYPDKTQIN